MQETDEFDAMPRAERNNLLKKLLEGEGIIVFPSEGNDPVDGLPEFNIMHDDLKEVLKDKNEKIKE